MLKKKKKKTWSSTCLRWHGTTNFMTKKKRGKLRPRKNIYIFQSWWPGTAAKKKFSDSKVDGIQENKFLFWNSQGWGTHVKALLYCKLGQHLWQPRPAAVRNIEKKKNWNSKDFVHIFICIFQRDPHLTMFETTCLKTKRIVVERNTKKKKILNNEDKGESTHAWLCCNLQVVVKTCG